VLKGNVNWSTRRRKCQCSAFPVEGWSESSSLFNLA